MAWNRDEAERLCGDLLQALINEFPKVNWERAGAKGDDGLIYFSTGDNQRVRVELTREALQDYRDADDRTKSIKEQKLADHVRWMIEDGAIVEAVITSADL